MSWFNEWLASELEARGMSTAAAARSLGCYPSDVVRWCASATPSFEVLDRIFSHFGGDLRRALPDYDPAAEVRADLLLANPAFKALVKRGLNLCMAVVGGRIVDEALVSVETQEELPVLGGELEASPMWGKTRGRLEVYRVGDGSLDPYLPQGSALYVREPRSASAVPEGSVCLFRHDGQVYVRELRWVMRGRRKLFAVARSLSPRRGRDLYLEPGQVELVGVVLAYAKWDGVLAAPCAL